AGLPAIDARTRRASGRIEVGERLLGGRVEIHEQNVLRGSFRHGGSLSSRRRGRGGPGSVARCYDAARTNIPRDGGASWRTSTGIARPASSLRPATARA